MADSPLWTIDAEIDVSRQALHRNSQPRRAPPLQYRFFSMGFRFRSVSSPRSRHCIRSRSALLNLEIKFQ
ncbi:hypothetical protein YC2023_036252 [Brassica napus]